MSLYPVSVGELIAGKYRLERVLGEGGMGLVVAARHVELDQQVAIKFLLPQLAQHVTASQRFRREARAAARIRGEHACRVLDVATLDNGVPYMVMEYLDGCDLASEILRRRRLPVIEAVDYVLQACEALAEAHSNGIVHRDLKPGNLFLAMRSDGVRCLKVLDFGVSKFLTDSDVGSLGLTGTSTMIGSPLYMSPEQLESPKDVDGRADIWSLGVVLFELITGRTPFVADTLAQLTHQVLSANAPTCGSVGVPVPEGLEQVLARTLSKRRDHRFASIADFARALVAHGPVNGAVSAARAARLQPGSSAARSAVDRAGIQGPVGAASAAEAGHGAATPAAWERKQSVSSRRRRTGWVLLGAFALLLASIGIAYRLQRGQTHAATAAAAALEHTLPPAAITAQPEPAPSPSPSKPASAGALEPVARVPPPIVEPVAHEQAAPPGAALPAKPALPQRPAIAPTAPVRAVAPPPAQPPRATARPLAATIPVPHKPAPESPRAPKLTITDFGGRR